MRKEEKIFYFRRFFCGRDDVYAFRVKDRGYRPRRTPDYKLTDAMIIRHMRGEVMLGAYPLLTDGGCDWIAADFDGHHGNAFEHAFRLAEKLREYEIEPLCNTSQSGNGVHVRVIFGDPVFGGERIKAWQARSFMNTFIEMCELPHLNHGGAFDRVFPTQDVLLDSDSIGNQIAMPLHQRAADERMGTMLLDRQFNTIPLGEATWDAIELHEPLGRIGFVDVANELGKAPEILRPNPETEEEMAQKRASMRRRKRVNSADLFDMVENCEFMKHAASHSIGYYEWIFLAANLAAFDSHGGRWMFHKMSSGDSRYDKERTDRKYDNVSAKMRPTTCRRICDEWRCSYLGGDGQCDKFRSRAGRGPRSPSAVPFFVGVDQHAH